MNIQFDSAFLTANEAFALTAFLAVLHGQSQPQPQPNQQTQIVSTVTPAGDELPPSAGPILVNAQPVAEPVSAAPEPATETSTRKRRTKAEMAADAAAAAAPPTVGDQLAAGEAARKAAAAQQAGSVKIDADQLRGLLNAYIAKHSMEAAIAILQSFGCNRVTEALALAPDKLAELAGKLNG